LEPILLHSVTRLHFACFSNERLLAYTFRLIDAPNLEHLRLTDLHADDGPMRLINFAPAIEALGRGALSSFERLRTLDMRRVSCGSKAAWSLFCGKLSQIRFLALCAMEVGPPDPEYAGHPYAEYLSALVETGDPAEAGLEDDATTGAAPRDVPCRNLETLLVSKKRRIKPLLRFLKKREELWRGIRRLVIAGKTSSFNDLTEEIVKMGLEIPVEWRPGAGSIELVGRLDFWSED
ncbi:hypothetical protein FRB90_010569, partial [Tulasnella sp. 427]